MPTCEELKARIEENLKGAIVSIENPRGDGAHFEAEVVFEGFEGKSLLEQHRMVFDALDKKFEAGSSMHALKLKTKVKNG